MSIIPLPAKRLDKFSVKILTIDLVIEKFKWLAFEPD